MFTKLFKKDKPVVVNTPKLGVDKIVAVFSINGRLYLKTNWDTVKDIKNTFIQAVEVKIIKTGSLHYGAKIINHSPKLYAIADRDGNLLDGVEPITNDNIRSYYKGL
jgi:hypothetical protein